MPPDVRWVVTDANVRLALLARPRGSDWLADDVRAWRRSGVTAVVSTLEPAEAADLGLADEPAACLDAGVEFLSLPICDRGVPDCRVEFSSRVDRLAGLLAAGHAVGVHCRAGIGRTSLVAACLLSRCGVGVAAAFEAIEAARGRPVPDTAEQRLWTEAWAAARPPMEWKNLP